MSGTRNPPPQAARPEAGVGKSSQRGRSARTCPREELPKPHVQGVKPLATVGVKPLATVRPCDNILTSPTSHTTLLQRKSTRTIRELQDARALSAS